MAARDLAVPFYLCHQALLCHTFSKYHLSSGVIVGNGMSGTARAAGEATCPKSSLWEALPSLDLIRTWLKVKVIFLYIKTIVSPYPKKKKKKS